MATTGSVSREPNSRVHACAGDKNPRGDKRWRPGQAVIGNVQNPAGGSSFDEQWLSEAANDLLAKPGASLVLAVPVSRSPYKYLFTRSMLR